MNSFQIQLVLLLLLVGVESIDQCREQETYQTCINSEIEQCMWISNRKLCQKTNDYLQGCSLTLNKKACLRQIGNAQGQPAKCRFIKVCEVIPNIKTEECQNNLSKSGCLSIQNPDQICFWKDDKCQVLYQTQWNQVQKDFDSVPYSASACFLIENYLVIHNTILWELIQYTPNLFVEADKISKKEMGLSVDTITFDNPNTVFMQNNYQFVNGSYAWYTIRESKEIKLSNLYKSYRYRDGCIALEIENDIDYLNLLKLTDEVRGINHIYCKYLNRNPTITKQYVYSDGVCKVFDKVDLNNQKKITEYKLNCKSMDYYQCIYFNSNTNICRLKGNEYEYPCVNQEKEYVANCINDDCTVRQCSKLPDYYMDTTTDKCNKSCSSFTLNTKAACEAIKGCKFLGLYKIFFSKVCAPQNGCDQLGLQKSYCQLMLDQCGWDDELQRCYRITEEEFKLKKCTQAFNARSCMMVTLSDQICNWDYIKLKCYNIIEYPILISHKALIDYEYFYNDKYVQAISNRNFCKYQQNVESEYLSKVGKCTMDKRNFVNDFKEINSYSCLMVQPGYCKWDSYQQICISFAETEVSEFNCLEQEFVNERICQKSKSSNPDLICMYDSEYNSCKEIKISEFEIYGCEGYGFSMKLCVSKQKLGELCQFSAGKCKSISESYINSIQCSSLQNVNQQVCQLYSSQFTVCLYDETTHSCYTPSIYTKLGYTENLNRYGCQQVQDSLTYFSLELNKCIQFSNLNTTILSNLECTQNFVNQQTCQSISKYDQNCFWDTNLNQCKRYSEYFINCAQYANFNYRVCTALASDMTKQFMKDNYCVFENNICQSKSNILMDCGESEQMNIHRCSGLTGLSQTGEYIQMCVFLNNKCKALIDNSMDTYIILNTISCKQANLKACTRVETNGQYCKLIDYVSANDIIIDKKCVYIDNTTETCSSINSNNSINLINPNYCSRASDSCLYDSVNGCISPVETNLQCNTLGLSYLGCIQNTQYHRCAYVNNKCQYLEQYSNVSDCKYLNQFSCSYFAFIKCYWNSQLCVSSTNDTTEYGSDYNCYLNKSSTFIVSNGNTCQTILQSNYELYSCDSKLNQFACGSIPNQYCQFIQNKCQFYSPILCEDSQQTCSENNSLNLKCVLKDGKCFDYPNNNYSCDFFEKSNYKFCLQYPNCVYVDQKCQQISQISLYHYCGFLSLLKCVLQNKQYACSWQSEQCIEFTETHCPSLKGYYSFNTCQQFQDCTYGFTKTGLGFCYSDKNFESLTCDQLNQDLCLEDLTHLNSSLFCYWDQSCKNIKNNKITQCIDLSHFQSSYAACNQLNQEQCMYSFVDQKCKLILEYNSTTCQGTTAKQCSQIKNICYFDGSICSVQGIQDNLNKYGCIKQTGTWKFAYFKCNQIINEFQKSCNNLSKDACLGDLTKELSCQWKDDKCQNVLQTQNKQLNSCENLNQRSCQNVRLSNIICVWNETLKYCDTLTITNTDCVDQNFAITTSISVCSGGQTNKKCAKYFDNTKCTEINVQMSNCNLYGLNQQACIQLTSIPCQWIQINDGGYCDDANLYSVHCIDQINQQACLNIQTFGQVCKWNQLTQVCQDQIISTCESASNLNSLFACNAVIDQPCLYDPISQLCNKIVFIPKSCSINYNKPSCEMSLINCIWHSNRCITSPYQNCQQYMIKSKCLESNQINCQWLNNLCTDFNPLYNKIFCKDLPININVKACSSNAIDPCRYDKKSASCLPDQDLDYYTLKTILNLIQMQTTNYQSPILSGKCEQLLTKDYCMKSRIPDKACIWKNSLCQEVIDLNNILCTEYLNFWGCLNVQKDNQLCFWKDQKCLKWNPTISQLENVNKNVCIQHSINRVYERNSCIQKDIQTILCSSEGISKITCLSIPNKKCQWINSCVEFTLSKQVKCSNFQNVTSYVCQMISNIACTYDKENKCCVDIVNDVVGQGVSKQACIQNQRIPTYWNGTICQELTDLIECDSQLIVNEYTCRSKVHNTSCIYDVINNQCTSIFNIWSLKCNSLGLNFLGCVSIKQEPCIFKDNKCQLFREVQSSCMFLSQVNSKACASLIDQYCAYDPINYKCQTPFIPQDYCNIQGINKNVCNSNSICLWNQDNLDCKCKSFQEIESCQQSNVSKCRSQNKCYFDLDQYSCVKKQCYHLKEDECNQNIDNKTCYRSIQNGCQPATICEDIIDQKNDCSTIFINQQPCVQAGNLCITSTNYKLYCPYSDCSNSNCIFYYGTCKMRTCEDYNIQDCQNNQNCYLDQENNCQDLLRCNQITLDLYGEQVINICNNSSVGGLKCNWQKNNLMDDTEICTNKVCEIYGASQTICQGNEINGYSCVYLGDLICKQCEQITESCLCNQQKNVCIYQNGRCRSILCSSFSTKEHCIQASDRCYWNVQQDVNNVQYEICVKECVKILDVDECNSRINECYFDNQNGLCIKGKKEIPDLSSQIYIEEFYSIQLTILIYLNMIIYF